jgi:3-deoxy-D-manno-octulosonate 8-phosphate phosphatase KdsC-like HAD superfamily phosphatase
LQRVLEDFNCFAKEVLYLGDDLFDYGIMREVGHPYCVSNSPRTLQDISAVLHCNGGENVVMHLFEDLEDRGLIPVVPYDEVMTKIYELDLKEKF